LVGLCPQVCDLPFTVGLLNSAHDSKTVDFRADWNQASGSVAHGVLPFPSRQINFAIAAGPGSYSGRHIDASGFGTVVEAVAGHKIWWILLPKADEHPDIFKNAINDPRDIDFKYWSVHAIRLHAGDLLYVVLQP